MSPTTTITNFFNIFYVKKKTQILQQNKMDTTNAEKMLFDWKHDLWEDIIGNINITSNNYDITCTGATEPY